jgi:multisubunit Na+/H+ antiporter MnhF subunit
MNAFLVAGTILIAGFIPLVAVCAAAREIDGLVALETCGTLATLAFICLAEGFKQSSYFTVPVICAGVTWIGGLIYARFLGKLG